MVRFEELVHLAYDAPLREEGWSPFLEAIMRRTGSRAACLKWLSLDTGCATMVSAGLERETERAYAERFAALDVWSKVPVAPGQNVFGDEMVARDALEATEFYADFCRPFAIRDIHKTVLARADDVQVSLGLLKPARMKDGARDRRLTARLAPHLRRALALTRLEDARGALAAALDHASAAVFFLDAHGRVVFASRAAERAAAARDGLSIVAREVRATRPRDQRALALHLGGATTAPVFLARPSGRAPYRAVAVPLHERHDDLARRGVVTLLFVDDRDVDPKPLTEATLRRIYGLTAAEARVAVRIGRGRSPREIADELHTSWHTVRAQLREVFAKTGTRRQSALVSLLSRLASPSGEEESF